MTPEDAGPRAIEELWSRYEKAADEGRRDDLWNDRQSFVLAQQMAGAMAKLLSAVGVKTRKGSAAGDDAQGDAEVLPQLEAYMKHRGYSFTKTPGGR